MLMPFDHSPLNELRQRRPLRRSETIACIVLDALAYAAQHSMPFVDALDSLPFHYDPAFRSPAMEFLNRPPLKYLALHPFCWAKDYPLSVKIDGAISDLRNGSTLSYALENSLGAHFPQYVIVGIDRAEQQGRLAAALPAIADSVRFPLAVADERIRELRCGAFRFIPLLFIWSFLAVFIAPKFSKVLGEMGVARPFFLYTAGNAGGYVFVAIHWLLVAVCVIYFAGRLPVLGEWLYLHLPFSRRELKRLHLAHLARTMYAFTADGTDVLTAAKWARDSTESTWLTERLDVFVGALEAGSDWVSAWCEMDLKNAFAEWTVRNAAARERPAEGFRFLLDKLYCDIDRSLGTWRTWADPLCVLALGAMVGAMVYALFTPLVQIILAWT